MPDATDGTSGGTRRQRAAKKANQPHQAAAGGSGLLRQHGEGTILYVRVRPSAASNELRGWQDGSLKVWVTAAAEKGKANKALMALLSSRLRLRKSQIELIAGQTSPQKQLLLQNIGPEELAERISRALGR